MEYVWKQKGSAVVELQEALVALSLRESERGNPLPKYGPDGDLGAETWGAVEAYAGVDQYLTSKPLPEDITDAILEQASEPVGEYARPDGYVRVDGDYKNVQGSRKWTDIDTIVLHQTGIWMNDTPERFERIRAHVGILADHATPIVQVQELTAYMYHANELNKRSVGFEMNGYWPGRMEDYHSVVHSGSGPKEDQIDSARDAIVWVMDEVSAYGGEIKHILPHRCSNDTRRADPGEDAWRMIGVWAQKELGLTAMGAGFCIADGTPIPGDWDGRKAYAGYPY